MITGSVTTELYVDCVESSADCHCTITLEKTFESTDFDETTIHDWLEENGWLFLTDAAVCPACKRIYYME